MSLPVTSNSNIKVVMKNFLSSNNNKIVITTKNFGIGLDQETAVLKNNPTLLPNTQLAVEDLINVQSVNEQTGYTLVFDQTTKKWITQPINLENATGTLNGGEF